MLVPDFSTFWSVREYMLPMICAAIFRVSVERSWKALWTMGMIKAREGASMKCTNLVSSRVCRQVWVLLEGSVRASSRMGVMAEGRTNGVSFQNKSITNSNEEAVIPKTFII